MMIYISEFIPICPHCSQKYVHLATLLGLHIHHPIPLYIKEGEDKCELRMADLIAVTTGSGMPTIICHDKEFYNYLKSLKSEGNLNEKVLFFFNRNIHYNEENYWIDVFYSFFKKNRGLFYNAKELISELQLNLLKGKKVDHILETMVNVNRTDKIIDKRRSSKTGRLLYGLKREVKVEEKRRIRKIKDGHTIRIRSFYLRNLRKFLRELILETFIEKERKLIEERDENSEDYKKWNALHKELMDFREKLYSSICVCRSCYRIDNDMVYFKELDEWFCVDCAGENSYHIEIYSYERVIYTNGQISNLYDPEDNESDDKSISYINKGPTQVPEEIPVKIALQLIKKKKAHKISSYKFELEKLFKKIKRKGLTSDELVTKVIEESSKIEGLEQLIKEARKFNQRKNKILNKGKLKLPSSRGQHHER